METMGNLMTQSIPLISTFIPWMSAVAAAVLCIVCIYIGFWMGRNQAGEPIQPLIKKRVDDTNDDMPVDIFDQAMGVGDELEDAEKRKPTII